MTKRFGNKAAYTKKNLPKLLPEIVKNAIACSRTDAGDCDRLGISKIGGKPHLPQDFVWPYFKGENYDGEVADRPLSFVAQINLAEAAPYDKDRVLPHTGMLYFFMNLKRCAGAMIPQTAAVPACFMRMCPHSTSR